MTAPLIDRYTDRKTHDCGCVTVWDTDGGGPRFLDACKSHYRYALVYSVARQHPKPKP